MAWFGDSFNQITNLTGQISSFTKEVLSETTEEVEDPVAELQVARKKISELEEINEHTKTEHEKLKAHCEEVSERLETSEYQISTISQEYRKLLQEKEDELKRCRGDNARLKEEHKHFVHDSTAQSPLKELAGGQFFENGKFETVDLGGGDSEWMGDFHDFSDVVTSQGVINQLQTDLARLKVECQHWKDMASVPTSDTGNSDHLREELKDLQTSLSREVEQHKREMSSMQTAHAEKIHSLNRHHQQEIELFNEKLDSADSTWRTKCAKLEEEVTQLKLVIDGQERIEQKVRELDEWNVQLQDDVQALRSEKSSIEGQLAESVSALEREKEVQGRKADSEKLQMQTKLGSLETSITHHQSEISKLQQEHSQSQSQIQQLRTNIQTLETQVLQKEAEITALRQARDQNVDTQTPVQSSHHHAGAKSPELISLKEQVKALQETTTGITKEKESLEHRLKALEADKKQLTMQLQDEEQAVQQLSINLTEVKGHLAERDSSKQDQMARMEELRVSKEALVSELEKKTEECHKYSKQLAQLKAHLLEVEERYTQDALKTDEREKSLHEELTELRERLIATATQESEQGVALREQLSRAQDDLQSMVEQRDDALLQMSNAQEQAHQNATALRNLQTVLEQFQRDQSSELAQALKRSQLELADVRSECSQLQVKLTEAGQLGQEVVSLRHELRGKDERLEQLHKELEGVMQAVEAEKKERLKLSSDSVERVDRALVKNLVLGYVHAPDAKKPEVLQLISKILGFTEVELAQAVGRGRGKGWLSSFWGGPPPQDHQESLSQLFVKFLETESIPNTPVTTPTSIPGYVDSRTDPDRPSLATATLVPPPMNTGALRLQPAPSTQSKTVPTEATDSRQSSILSSVLSS